MLMALAVDSFVCGSLAIRITPDKWISFLHSTHNNAKLLLPATDHS